MVYKRVGLGHTLGVDANGGSSFTNIGALFNLNGSESSKDDIEVSLFGDNYKDYRPGQIDSGTFDFEVALDREDAVNITLSGLFARTAADTIPTWQITSPLVAGSTTQPTRTFAGYVNKLSETYEKNGLAVRKIGVKITGDPGYST